MPLPDPASRARLAEMGIEVWLSRTQDSPTTSAVVQGPVDEPRVRLAAGVGAWLLVQRRPWDGRHAELLADLQALLGADQCRFGHWADSREAGQALSELPERGVRHVLCFGPPPAGAPATGLIALPMLDEIATSAAARRGLWHALRPLLEHS
ncbi:MAG: hypothetical protein ACXIUM_03095 [Wenzhouxiangella sp.]